MKRIVAIFICICMVCTAFGTASAVSGFESDFQPFGEQEMAVTIAVIGHEDAVIVEPTRETSFPAGTSVLEVLVYVLEQRGISYTLKDNHYLCEIAGLKEKDYGESSGWMNTVNGKYPALSMDKQYLYGGEDIMVRYVEEYVQIEATPITHASASVANQWCTGTALKPHPQVWLNGYVLREGIDYILNYAQNTAPGEATVYVVGIGDFSGVLTAHFHILLKKPVPKLSVVSAAAVKLTWAKVAGAAYYRVYEYLPTSGKYTLLATTKATGIVIKNQAAGSAHYYLVKACAKEKSGTEVCSAVARKDCIKAVMLCKAPAVKGTAQAKRVNLSWKRCAGAAYYRVYAYNPKTGHYTTLVKSTAKQSVSFTKQTKGTHYYLVRAFNTAHAGSTFSTKNLVKVSVK